MRAAEAEAETAGLGAWAGKRVAAYTLDPGAGQRFQAVVEALCPGVHVDVFDATVATERMGAAARSADVFVVATRSATHSATEQIERLAKQGVVRYAAGKGTTSLLRALEANGGA